MYKAMHLNQSSHRFESAIEFSASFEDPFGHVAEIQERQLTGVELASR
jgi:hypothetical protein